MADAADVFKIEIAWATAPWATSPTWVDITDISDAEREKRGIRGADVTVGGSVLPGIPAPPGVCVFTANNLDADWDSENASSVFGASNILRNKKVRVRVSDTGTFGDNRIFTGYIDDIVPSGDSIFGTVTVSCTDIFRLLSEIDVEVTRAAELTGQRAAAILDAAGVPAGLRGTVENGSVMMPAVDVASDAMSLLKQCAKAENGFLFVDHDGDVNFVDRYGMTVAPFESRLHSFTADGNGATSSVRMGRLERSLGAMRRITATTASSSHTGNAFTFDDTPTDTPKSEPPEAPLGVSTLYDADTRTLAEAFYKSTEYDDTRILEVPVHVWGLGDSLPTNELTAIEAGYYDPYTRVEIQTQPVGFASDWNFEARIEAVRHTLTPESWSATLRVFPHDTTFEQTQSGWGAQGSAQTGKVGAL